MASELLFEGAPGTRILAMGDEAIARGAIEAGIHLATGYPGTPSTEIMETLIEASNKLGFLAYWSVNEKVAFDAATGASFSRARALVVMKHVGLNVAADSLMQLNLIDIAGGFVLVSVDDPGGLSSNNEQDNRWYAKFAEIPAVEPSDLNEAREMTKRAFEISETLRLPVMIRSVTRLGHMTGDLILGSIEPPEKEPYFDSSRQWSPFPPLIPHRRLKEKMRKARKVLASYAFDRYEGAGNEEVGIAAAGFTYNYAKEAVDRLGVKDRVAILKVSTVNPLPRDMIHRLLSHVRCVLVLEDVSPFLEEAIRAEAQELERRISILGRQSGALPDTGETNIDDVVQALQKLLQQELAQMAMATPVASGIRPDEEQIVAIKESIPKRQITLCAGCPHRATYYALKKALEGAEIEAPIILGDIGCYALGFFPPFNILQTMTSMGASMGTASTLAQLNPGRKVIAVIGDSTLYHAGQPGLLQISHLRAPVLVLVMDNAVTASTGQQPHPGTWQMAEEQVIVPIEDIAQAYKIPHVRVVGSFQIRRLIEEFQEALTLKGPSLIVSRQVCALEPSQRTRRRTVLGKISSEKCDGCLDCIEEFGCPAFVLSKEDMTKVAVDEVQCDGCACCRIVCPQGAIYFEPIGRQS